MIPAQWSSVADWMRIVASALNPVISYFSGLKGLLTYDDDNVSFNNIVVIDVGDSSIPALWLKSDFAGAWPGFLIEAAANDDDTQAQLFWKTTDTDGTAQIWQIAHDAKVNFRRFNIEAVDPVSGVISTPLSLERTGEVGIGGNPTPGVECTINGNLLLAPAASATPSSNGQLTFELTSNTELKIKVKGSDGTVRSVSLILA